MSAARDLLSELRSLGVEVTGRGGKLHIKAPVGVLTEARRRQLADAKPELLALVSRLEPGDDRRWCHQCRNLGADGLCQAAARGELRTARRYQPIDWPPRRCIAYVPQAADADQRSGRERWNWIMPAPAALQ